MRLDGLSAFAWSGLVAAGVLAVWLSVRHIVRVVRKVRTLISQATDDTPADVPDRHRWDSHNADAVLLTHEQCDDEESNETAADFVLWKFELDADPAIHKYMRRMDRRPAREES